MSLSVVLIAAAGLICSGADVQISPPIKDDGSSSKRRREEEALDEALKNTFPASDPVSVEQPIAVTGHHSLPAPHRSLG